MSSSPAAKTLPPAILAPRHYRAAAALAIALGLGLAWINRFVQDDAFIVFRYAQNLAQGHGLSWNPGEPVEGYTTFLHTLLMVPAFLFGFEPVRYSYVLGLGWYALGLAAFSRAARETLGDDRWAIVALVLLGTNYTFSAFATGGLETSLDAALICIAMAVVARNQRRGWSGWGLVGLYLLDVLALMTRIDSIVPVGVLTAVAIRRTIVQNGLRAAVRRTSVAAIPAILLIAGWAAWKLWYYGDVLPNTFYVKVGSSLSWSTGASYLYYFFMSYWLVPFALLAVVTLPQLIVRDADALTASIVTIVLWMLYVLRVSGDFMEFRFLVPMLPSLMLMIAASILAATPRWSIRIALALAVVAGSVNHANTFSMLSYHRGRPETRMSLIAHLRARHLNWVGIGTALARDLPNNSGVRIAVAPAGAIPFFSGLPAIDMLGLNDRWVARFGDEGLQVPGHQRLAPMSYLMDREVNLVIGHPLLVETSQRPPAYTSSFLRRIRLTERNAVMIPAGLRVVEVPIDGEYVAPMVYLTPHPLVDRLIVDGKWRAVGVVN